MAKFSFQGEVPAFAQIEQGDRVVWNGAPRFYRTDGSVGEFYVGSASAGDTLTCQIFEWRWDSGERWSRKGQSWLDLAIVDAEGVASILPLNKDSAVNVFDFLISLKQTGATAIDCAALRVDLAFVEQETQEHSTYFVVDVLGWEFAPEADWLRVAAFRDSRLFNWVLVGEVG